MRVLEHMSFLLVPHVSSESGKVRSVASALDSESAACDTLPAIPVAKKADLRSAKDIS